MIVRFRETDVKEYNKALARWEANYLRGPVEAPKENLEDIALTLAHHLQILLTRTGQYDQREIQRLASWVQEDRRDHPEQYNLEQSDPVQTSGGFVEAFEHLAEQELEEFKD